MKDAGKLLMMLLFTVSLTACPDKGGDSNGSAATPKTDDPAVTTTVACQWNWQLYNYVDANNNVCTPTQADLNNSNYCHNYIYNWSTNSWVDKNGTAVSCVQGYIDFNHFQPYQFYYGGTYQANCKVYGYGWYPMQFGASLVCVKKTYVNQYYPNFNYYNSSSYYPTTCRYGVDCFSRCGGVSAGGNYGGLWFGGTLGLCL